jgi:hypothetical protein
MAWLVLASGAVVAALLAATGLRGLFYLLLYLGAVAPGIFAGGRATGQHPAGFVAGALAGYGTTQLALWLPVFLGIPSRITFLLSWFAFTILLLWIGTRIKTPLLNLPAWTGADHRAIALTLLLVPALMGPPYRNLGAADEAGTRWYRAYFTADFVWHTALTSELGRYDSPPHNPYEASSTLHYYWTYFMLPAVAAEESAIPVQDALKANAILSAAFVLAMLFVLTRAAVPKPGAAAAAVSLVVLATSAEGAYSIRQLWEQGKSFAGLLDTNIDAVSSWEFHGLRIDGLARGFWYNPHHSMACGLGLVAAFIAATAGRSASRGAIWCAGVTLGLATTMNPFVGAVCAAIYGVSIAIDAIGQPDFSRTLLRHSMAALPVLAGVGWSTLNQVSGGASNAVAFGWLIGLAHAHPGKALLLSVGPALVPALAGLWPARTLPSRPLLVAAAGTMISLLLMHTMRLTDASWVGFRTGQLLQLMLPLLLARTLWIAGRIGAAGPAAIAAGILALGLPTTAIDTYNAQDIGNRHMGPGFHWTVPLSAGQQHAFEWVRASLPKTAVIQMEPLSRGREQWSLIPSFAERRMSIGMPISLLPSPEYEAGSKEIQRIYKGMPPHEAWETARRHGIDYFYVDTADRTNYCDGLAVFDSPDYFTPVFQNTDVMLYKVNAR